MEPTSDCQKSIEISCAGSLRHPKIGGLSSIFYARSIILLDPADILFHRPSRENPLPPAAGPEKEHTSHVPA